jgi:hypothetical protein
MTKTIAAKANGFTGLVLKLRFGICEMLVNAAFLARMREFSREDFPKSRGSDVDCELGAWVKRASANCCQYDLVGHAGTR